ncbi:MAG: hypothetical protein RJA70_16 [Pseudomonadota bacterium]|jgi:DNA modification methylase
MRGHSVRLSWLKAPPVSAPAVQLEACADPGRLQLIHGDNLSALGCLANEFTGGITLAYLDPPFLTGRQHSRVTRAKDARGKVLRAERFAFDDRWSGMGEYLDALGARLQAVRTLLAPHGSVVVHVDPKTSHYVKILCDEVFGPDAFASEVIWRYRRWPSKTPNFQRVHDVLLRYVKDPEVKPRFNQLYEPLASSTVATWGTRQQRAVTDAAGRRVRSTRTDQETPGVPLGDVWEIGIIAPVAKERTGYPTQKPEALIRRLLLALTDPDDWVLDPYAGSGTTLAIGGQLGRRVIAIDQSVEALEVAQARCAALSLPLVQRRIVAHGRVAKAS